MVNNHHFSVVIWDYVRAKTYLQCFFSLYLNDLEGFLETNACQGIELQLNTPEFLVYVKLLVLLYADDTAVLADNQQNLQRNLDYFYEYCQQWKLNVNFSKTKIIVFGARKTSNLNFQLGGNQIEITDNFKYLGIYLSKTRTFYKARKTYSRTSSKGNAPFVQKNT